MVDLKKLEFKINIIISGMMILGGGILNVFAVAVNNGKMPVLIDYYFETELHRGISSCEEATRCIIVDIFRIGDIYFSVGDVFILFGVVFSLYYYIKRFVEWVIFKRRFYKMKKDLEDRF